MSGLRGALISNKVTLPAEVTLQLSVMTDQSGSWQACAADHL
jgi:hypothetical protein